jgi:hypothetical protein
MKTLLIKNNCDIPSVGKLMEWTLVVNVDNEKKYKTSDKEMRIAIEEGVHSLEFSVSMASLFLKMPTKLKTTKTINILDDQEINVYISKDNILVKFDETSANFSSLSAGVDILAYAKSQGQLYDALYFFAGDEGRTLTVYEDRVSIKTKLSLLGSYSGSGEKTIYYEDCTGVQFKASTSGMVRGFLQIETSSMEKNENNYYSENSFVWNIGKKSTVTNEQMEQIRNFIQDKVRTNKKAQVTVTTSNVSSADELKKFKELLDAGIISQEEFDAKKKQLLGL